MNDAPEFRIIPNDAERSGTVPNDSEAFGTVRNAAEPFRTVRNSSERSNHHTLTVREVARMFEQAGVPRTERSIVKWCQPNAQGIARLDAYLDTNERRYFITPESVNRAIEEEKSRQEAAKNSARSFSSLVGEEAPSEAAPKRSEPVSESHEAKIRDLEITNRVKDHYIERLEKQIDAFDRERQHYVEQLMNSSHRLGELEVRLQLSAPVPKPEENLPHDSDISGGSWN